MTAEATESHPRQLGPFKPPRPRRVSFDFAGDCPPYWLAGSYSGSVMLNAYTLVFPALETMMMREIKRIASKPGSPVDQAAVRGFIQQEGSHAREHRRSIDMVRAQGYDVEKALRRIEKGVFSGLEILMRKIADPFLGDTFIAGIMAAGEHWTAVLSEMAFTPGPVPAVVGRLDVDQPPPLTELEVLYLWHCAEELEHKNVVADVFADLGGSEATRLVTFVLASSVFLFLTTTTMFSLMRQSPRVLGPGLWPYIGDVGGWKGLSREARVSLGPLGRSYLKAMRTYFKKGFHPSDIDTDQLAHQALARLEELRLVEFKSG